MFTAADIYGENKEERDNLECKINITSRQSPPPIAITTVAKSNSDYPKIVNGIEVISEIQEKIVFSDDRIITIFGCAGSRKTDCLCKYGYQQFRQKRNVLFLTLVSSVTDEIKTRLSSLLGFDIPRIRKSNHFCTIVDDTTIQISNFDAFIHRQLYNIGHEVLLDGGDLHSEKANCLLASDHTGATLISDQEADVILVDEFQDLQLTKVKILIKILEANKSLRGFAVGDYMQSIFDHAITTEGRFDIHPLTLWTQELKSTPFEINTCYRCPAPQIDFVNYILQEYQQKHNLLPMKSGKSGILERGTSESAGALSRSQDKPIIFVHEDISKKTGNNPAMLIADQVHNIIKSIMRFDKQIKAHDIAILVKNSNDNKIVHQLEKNMRDVLHHFATIEDGSHLTIQWEKAADKTVAISIHGIKGKGKKVVILLNLSNKSFPEEQNFMNPTEILDYSLLNVGLTRSEQYLIVGIPSTSPTRYFFNKRKGLEQYAYCTWSEGKTIRAHFPPTYKRIVRAITKSLWNQIMIRENKFYRLRPMFEPKHYLRNYPVNIPPRRILRVSVEIAKSIEHPKYLLSGGMLTSQALHSKGMQGPAAVQSAISLDVEFGKPVYLNDGGPTQTDFDNKLTLDERAILGNMAELLVNRHLFVTRGDEAFKQIFIPVFHRNSHVYYTDNDVLLNLVADFGLNRFALPTIFLNDGEIAEDEIEQWRYRLNIIMIENKFMLAKRYRDTYYDLIRLRSERPKIVIHQRFNSDEFRAQLTKLWTKEPNQKIDSKLFWNATIYSIMFDERSRRPGMIWYYNSFHYNLDVIHKNVTAYCSKYIPDVKDLYRQINYNQLIETTESDLKQLGYQEQDLKDSSFYYGISGRSDLYAKTQQKIIETKCSIKSEISKEWIIQALVYCVLLPERSHYQKEVLKDYHPNQFQIVNLLRGVVYDFKLPHLIDKAQVIWNTLKKLGWQDVLINNIIKSFYGASAMKNLNVELIKSN